MTTENAQDSKPPAIPPLSALAGSAKILHCGFIIELAEHGPWLKNDLTWTPHWGDRGIWHERTDAEQAIARSLAGDS